MTRRKLTRDGHISLSELHNPKIAAIFNQKGRKALLDFDE
jgi:hypothetical protein